MKIEIKEIRGTWRQVADAARTTIKQEAGEKEPSDSWKKSITRAGHSPIRLIEFHFKAYDVPYWVVGHNVRHKHGIEHWVSTQREDRTGVPRSELTQDALVDYEFIVNLEELMFICNRRLCKQAAPETTAFWKAVIDELGRDPDAHSFIWPVIYLFAPMCVRCGGKCPEMKSCQFNQSRLGKVLVDRYWNDD